MNDTTTPSYKVGDTANGYVLKEDGQWHQITEPQNLLPEPKAPSKWTVMRESAVAYVKQNAAVAIAVGTALALAIILAIAYIPGAQDAAALAFKAVGIAVMVLAGIALAVLPIIVALMRHHRSTTTVVVLNLGGMIFFFVFPIIWLIALVVACTPAAAPPVTVVVNNNR